MGFKDVMKSFLYETVEDDELEEEEEVSTPDRTLPNFLKRHTPTQETLQPTSQTPTETVQPEQLEQLEQLEQPEQPVVETENLYVEPQVVVQPQSSQFLDAIEDVVETQEEKTTRPSYIRPQVNRANRNTIIRQDYSSIISPIYGDVKEDQKDATLVHDAFNLTKPVDASEMTMIISPIFGAPQTTKQPVVKVDSKRKAAPRKEAEPIVTASKESSSSDLASFLSRPAGQPANSVQNKTETK